MPRSEIEAIVGRKRHITRTSSPAAGRRMGLGNPASRSATKRVVSICGKTVSWLRLASGCHAASVMYSATASGWGPVQLPAGLPRGKPELDGAALGVEKLLDVEKLADRHLHPRLLMRLARSRVERLRPLHAPARRHPEVISTRLDVTNQQHAVLVLDDGAGGDSVLHSDGRRPFLTGDRASTKCSSAAFGSSWRSCAKSRVRTLLFVRLNVWFWVSDAEWDVNRWNYRRGGRQMARLVVEEDVCSKNCKYTPLLDSAKKESIVGYHSPALQGI